MALTAESYARQLKALLPQGAAWKLDPIGVLGRVMLAIATELARIDQRARDLEREVDPRTTVELLSDFERVLGLPDPCVTESLSADQRRQAVVAKLTSLGGQSRQFFIDLAAAMGYVITITEFRPFIAGSVAGDDLTNGAEWINSWQVNAPQTTISEFRAGLAVAGDPLRSWGNEGLECVMQDRKPAHTRVLFTYS